MSIITIFNVKNRTSSLMNLQSISISESAIRGMSDVYDRFMNSPNSTKDKFKFVTEHWMELDHNSNIAFNKIIDAFDKVCESGNIGDINTVSGIIAEKLVPKVRDGMQAMNYVKMKTRRFKTKLSTKITNKIDGNKSAASDVAANIQDKLQVKGAIASAPQTQQQQNKEEAAIEAAYKKIEEALSVQVQCDRILKNYRTISKYMNLNETFKEAYDIEDAIEEVCDLVSRFSAESHVQFNTALESCWYAININHLSYNGRDIVNAVTDYFLFRESFKEEDIKPMAKVLYESKIFGPEEISESYDTLTGDTISKTTLSIDEQMLDIEFENGINVYTEGVNKAQQLINNFKKDAKKTPEKLKTFITKFFVLSKNNIVDGTPSILNTIRQFVVLSTLAIGPIVFCVTLIANYAIKMKLRRKETAKIRDDIKKEKDKVKKKIDNAKSEATKKRLEEYLKSLDSTYKKVDDYYRSLHTDDENYQRDEEEGFDGDDEEFDFDFDFGDDDFNIESAVMNDIVDTIILAEAMSSLPDRDLTDDIINNLSHYSVQELASITDLVCATNDLVNVKKLKEAMEECRDNDSNSVPGYRSMLVNSIYKLEHIEPVENSIEYTINLLEAVKSIYTFNDSISLGVLQELNISNTLKLAADKVKKTAVKLSDKEKAASRTIDSSLNTLRDSTERALRNDNREAIIRGSMLPSASKVIKGAIIGGTAFLVNPAVAVIGALGAFAMNKRLKAKERQLILDDIEVELKMCEKYIRAAEDNNDMKALKQLYTIQKNLERQKQRIRYNMRVKYNQNVPNTASSDDD